MKRRVLPHIHLGRAVRIPKEALVKWESQRTVR